MKPIVTFAALAVALAAPQAAYAVSDEDFQQLKKALDTLVKERAADQARIRALEGRVKSAEAEARAAKAAAEGAKAGAPPAPATTQAAAPPPPPPPPPSGAPATQNAFNPAIGVVLNGNVDHFGRDPDRAKIPGFALGDDATPGTKGFSLDESEINLSANIDQALYGELTVSYPGDETVSVEEAFIQSLSLPYGFVAKGGRFFSRIGYLNEQHAHAWDFIDAPLPYRAMLNNQYGDDGVQLRWLAPTDFLLEFGGEWFRGDAFPATPANGGKGTYTTYVRSGGDVGTEHSWQAGLSYMHNDAKDLDSQGGNAFTGQSDLGIASLVWKWAPDGNPIERNLKLQSEFFFRHQHGLFNEASYDGNQTGWYIQGVYQFMPQWRIGARYDQLSSSTVGADLAGSVLDNQGRTPRRYSGLVEYDTSEFGRFRLQYNRDDSDVDPDNAVLFQYTVTFGSHGAHQY
ncbi:MAG: hypothetical protein ACM3N5_07965 [Candidatus Eiseniibacteriota bacterium]